MGKCALICHLDEYKQGIIVAISNFGSEAYFGEGTDELLELFDRASLVCSSQ